MPSENRRPSEISTNMEQEDKRSSYDPIRVQARKLQGEREDHTRPPLLTEAEKYMSKEDKEQWETQNRELLERLAKHKEKLNEYWDKTSETIDPDSLKANLSEVCNDMALYANAFMKYANAHIYACLKHLEVLGEKGLREKIDFDNLYGCQPYRDCLSYYSKLGRQACKEWGKVVIGLVKRYQRIASGRLKTSDLNLNSESRVYFSKEKVIQNLRNFDTTFDDPYA